MDTLKISEEVDSNEEKQEDLEATRHKRLRKMVEESEAEPQPQHDPQVQVLDHVTQPENVEYAVDEHVEPHTDSSQVELILQSLTQMRQHLQAQEQKLKDIMDYLHHHCPPKH
ncbi:unnamed protein product [Lupinus luteus]|uniref:Uncharacterized protein n=1 Tax=Lupinus luteus TaxID=3873 RepID=A0AAV1Y678_LUPLU